MITVLLDKQSKNKLLDNLKLTEKTSKNRDYVFDELIFYIKYTHEKYDFFCNDIDNIINSYIDDIITMYYVIDYYHGRKQIEIDFGNNNNIHYCLNNTDNKKILIEKSLINFKKNIITFKLTIINQNDIIAVTCDETYSNSKLLSKYVEDLENVNVVSFANYYIKNKYDNGSFLNYYTINNKPYIQKINDNKYNIVSIAVPDYGQKIHIQKNNVIINDGEVFECVIGMIKELIETVKLYLM